MAQINKTLVFKNATIDMQDKTITEFLKDETKVYKLDDVLNDWNKVDGITFSIKQVDDLPTSDEGNDE
jgi:hypothetical protein